MDLESFSCHFGCWNCVCCCCFCIVFAVLCLSVFFLSSKQKKIVCVISGFRFVLFIFFYFAWIINQSWISIIWYVFSVYVMNQQMKFPTVKKKIWIFFKQKKTEFLIFFQWNFIFFFVVVAYISMSFFLLFLFFFDFDEFFFFIDL